MVHTGNQTDLILPTLANIALGKLIAGLKIPSNTTLWPNPMAGENTNDWYVPKVGGGTPKVRAPGASVVFEDRTSSRVRIPTKQYYDAFEWDESIDASKAVAYYEPFIQTCVDSILEGIEADAMQILATASGITAIGTLGSSVTRTHLQQARLQFLNNKVPLGRLTALISGETSLDIANITEYTRMDSSGDIGARTQQEGLVRMASGFRLEESPYVYSPAANQHRNLLFDPGSIMHIFPAQTTQNSLGQQKVEAARDGFRLYMLLEGRPGTNGGRGVTVSCNFGIAPVRTEGLIHLNGK
jgi:hypothetical protein